MMETERRIWEVVGAIHGNCVYVKQNLLKSEARDFMEQMTRSDGSVRYQWPDGDAIFAQPGTSAFWMRIMYEYENKKGDKL